MKLIIQIAYNPSNLEERAHSIKEQGHELISILGNSDALRQRDQFAHADAVVLGHAADVNVRRKIAQWVKANYPQLRLISIGDEVPEADVAVQVDDRKALLRAIDE